MNCPTKPALVGLLAYGILCATAAFALPASLAEPDLNHPGPLFPKPDIIRYDGQCLTIHGQDQFIYSGTFHYFRCPKELWRERFAKIKAAGFNCVETYIPWNLHEPAAPSSLTDFSQVDLRDFEDWLNLAESFQLYVIARPGPFICAEWNRGGFPGWLVNQRPQNYKQPAWFRSSDPQFIAWSCHWLDAVLPVIARHQITQGSDRHSGVIMVFLENEYSHSSIATADRASVMSALIRTALARGIEVPLVECEDNSILGSQDPWLSRCFGAINCYPGWKAAGMAKGLKALRRLQPNAPLMIAEAQGGWFTHISEAPFLQPEADVYREDATGAQLNNLTLFALQNGVTILNYYVLVGGTNLRDTGSSDMATSYDYSAPIRENGGVGEKYRRVAALGKMLQKLGPALARSHAVSCSVTTAQKDVSVAVRACPNGKRFFFVRTDQHAEARHGRATVRETATGKTVSFTYDLEPFGAKLLYLPAEANDQAQGQWLPECSPATPPPKNLPAPVLVNAVECRADPGPTEWHSLPAGAALNEVGIYDSRFVYYRALFTLSEQTAHAPNGLRLCIRYSSLAPAVGNTGLQNPTDHVLLRVNGHSLGEAETPVGDLTSLPPSVIHPGQNVVELLYQNSGYFNKSEWMEKKSGIFSVRLLPASPADQRLAEWKMRLFPDRDVADASPELDPAYDDREWQRVKIDQPSADQLKFGQSAIFRAVVDVTAHDLASGRTGLFISQLSDYGALYCNGIHIADTHSRIISSTIDLAPALRPGRNVLAIAVRAADKLSRGGLGRTLLTWPPTAGILPDQPLQFSDQPTGISGKWYMGNSHEAGWTSTSFPEQPAPNPPLLSWRRLSFSLPEFPSGVYVPWLARLVAQGDGFIYLNGRQLGRYSEHGGQRDFYLPECWLKFGSQQTNNLTLCLRAANQGAAVRSAAIIPFNVYAEQASATAQPVSLPEKPTY